MKECNKHIMWCSIIRSITRHKILFLLLFGVCTSAIMLLNIYAANITNSRHQFEILPEAYDVSGRITNLNGTQDVGLEISSDVVDGIMKNENVKNVVASMQIAAVEGDDPSLVKKSDLNIAFQASNDISGIYGLNWEDIELADKVDRHFLESDEAYFLGEKTFLKNNELEVGDKLSLVIFHYVDNEYGRIDWDYLTKETFTIAGTMEQTGVSADIMYMDGVVPWGWAVKTFKECGITYIADSLRFKVKDPEQINGLKKDLKKLNLMEIVSSSENRVKGNTVIMQDAAYINAATQLKSNMQLYEMFFPIVILITVSIGYVISFLLMQNRRAEYLLMRLLGVKAGECLIQFILEIILTMAAACLFGVILLKFLQISSNWWIFGLYIISFLSGSVLSLIGFTRKPILTALSQQ